MGSCVGLRRITLIGFYEAEAGQGAAFDQLRTYPARPFWPGRFMRT